MKILAFDSGFGGLTSVAPLLAKPRGIDLHYFGDLANLPYGTKSPDRVRALTLQNISSLLNETSYDHVLLACNTASSHAYDSVVSMLNEKKLATIAVGVVGPSCEWAMKKAKSRIVVLGTSATVSSGAYRKQLEKLGFAGEVTQVACPLFVPFVEEQIFEGPALEWVVRHYLDSVLRPGDVAILGCTHYPYLLEILTRIYPGVTWIESGEALLEAQSFSEKEFSSQQNSLRVTVSDRTLTQDRVLAFLNHLGIKEPSQLLTKFEVRTFI